VLARSLLDDHVQASPHEPADTVRHGSDPALTGSLLDRHDHLHAITLTPRTLAPQRSVARDGPAISIGALADFAVVTGLHLAAVFAAGIVAGAMNAVVGAGTLVSFPALLALGIPPVMANATNTVGLVPGSLAGAYGYRHQLGPLLPMIRRAVVPAALGGVAGAILLLWLPASTFDAVVPILLLVAAALVAAQPWITRWLVRRSAAKGLADDDSSGTEVRTAHAGPGLLLLVFCVAVYGGYFGAAMSVLLLALFGVVLGGVQASNGLKNVLAAVINFAAAVVFAFSAQVDWVIVPVLAVGSALGGLAGGRYGRDLPDRWLRLFVVLLAVTVAIIRSVR
jgi:uncharacterized protein